ncbi:uncharacterized protein SCHCODRAFT_02608314 [Schizophyllum commune H4-8]|uniref:Uncharacterized protein n=1 Tax=Schizophyllum commune (strain H4-8 / FGSC 9210) TaxID=578458 RepID=D8PUW5_SCHCM|nr:uncharacterized protein SCHCODRAFT_02608314 [Schizophyllum commune H4-8]KAI5900593.1 hypothetical protein SCHCODRAFT_02608314 [Schizophyllum commune H4-8]
MRTFTFSSLDILNSSIVPEGSDFSEYTVETTGGKGSARGVTTLSGAFDASINWSEKYFDIAGQTLPFNELDKKMVVDGRQRSGRLWQWGNAQYELKCRDRAWTVTDLLTDTVVAHLRTAEKHTFQRSKPARLALERDIPPAELAFLILALLASEARWLDIMKPGFNFWDSAPSQAYTSAGWIGHRAGMRPY